MCPPVSPHQHPLNFSHSVLALAVGHFLYVRNLLFAQDVGIASNEKIIMQEIEMMVSVSTNVIITLRPFAKDFNTSFGQGGGATVAYGISKAYGGNSGGGVKSSSRNNDRGLGSITANRLGLSSKSGSMGKSGPRSWGAEKAGADGVELEGWRKSSYKKAERRMLETSDSSKDLTGDVITQTIDYQVEYEEKSEEGERSRGSERW
jgi:hypothetical protein